MTAINWKAVQTRLGATPDGVAGPKTWAAVFNRMAGRDLGDRARDLGIGATHHLPRYGITSLERVAHFLGQTAHESGHYRYMRELWGPTPTQLRYEGRGDLGNTVAGDGKRYLGRGILQITGRSNYARVGKRIGLDLEANPVMAERPDIAVQTAADWWHAYGCNDLADDNEGVALGRLINRGSAKSTKPANGEADRIALTNKAKALLA